MLKNNTLMFITKHTYFPFSSFSLSNNSIYYRCPLLLIKLDKGILANKIFLFTAFHFNTEIRKRAKPESNTVFFSHGELCYKGHSFELKNSSNILEKAMAPHSSTLAWRIPGTGEPGGLLSMESHRVGHD